MRREMYRKVREEHMRRVAAERESYSKRQRLRTMARQQHESEAVEPRGSTK